jgi:hypothetical protein
VLVWTGQGACRLFDVRCLVLTEVHDLDIALTVDDVAHDETAFRQVVQERISVGIVEWQDVSFDAERPVF